MRKNMENLRQMRKWALWIWLQNINKWLIPLTLDLKQPFFFFRPDIVIALAGNKSDLANRRAVEFEEANGYAEENGLLFMETSAKNANNVNEIFLAIARKLPRWVMYTRPDKFWVLKTSCCIGVQKGGSWFFLPLDFKKCVLSFF